MCIFIFGKALIHSIWINGVKVSKSLFCGQFGLSLKKWHKRFIFEFNFHDFLKKGLWGIDCLLKQYHHLDWYDYVSF